MEKKRSLRADEAGGADRVVKLAVDVASTGWRSVKEQSTLSEAFSADAGDNPYMRRVVRVTETAHPATEAAYVSARTEAD